MENNYILNYENNDASLISIIIIKFIILYL